MTRLGGAASATAQLAELASLPRRQLILEAAHELDRLVVDEADRLHLVWVRVPARSGPPVVVLLAEDAAGPASPARALSRLVATGPGRWPTGAGGAIRWTGPAIRAGDDTGGLAATASNDLLAGQVDGRPAVLKAYRLLGSDRGEGGLLAALAGGFTPRPLAEIGYRPPGPAAELPLGLVTERLPGRTLDRPLLDGLRQAWRAGRPDLDPDTEAALTRVRSALGGFGAALELACGPRPVDPAQAVRIRRDELRAELQALDDPAAHGRPARFGPVLAAAAASVAGLTQPDPGPAHCDLHLANVLLGRDRVFFVDVAQPDPHRSAADDGAALRRAVECMALDVLVDRVAAAQLRAPIEVVDELLATASAGSSDGPGPLESVLPMEFAVTRRWVARVSDRLDPWGAGGRLNLPYLSRLVHDLRHHTDRGDRHYAGLAWYHLAQACAHRPARTLTQGKPKPEPALEPKPAAEPA
jgi:hypothetical protein